MLDPQLLRLDRTSVVPLHEQLRAQLAVAIRVGSVAPASALPTIRALAEQLDVAPGTVGRAYQELEREGLVTGRKRAGTVVVDEPPESELLADRARRLNELVDEFVAEANRVEPELEVILSRVADAWRVDRASSDTRRRRKERRPSDRYREAM